MFNLIFNICQYIFPLIGLIGFIINNSTMMILSVIFSIFQGLLGYYTGQLKPGAAHISSLFIIGLIISFIFNIEWYKGLTITFVFGNIIILIFGFFLIILSIFKKKNNN